MPLCKKSSTTLNCLREPQSSYWKLLILNISSLGSKPSKIQASDTKLLSGSFTNHLLKDKAGLRGEAQP